MTTVSQMELLQGSYRHLGFLHGLAQASNTGAREAIDCLLPAARTLRLAATLVFEPDEIELDEADVLAQKLDTAIYLNERASSPERARQLRMRPELVAADIAEILLVLEHAIDIAREAGWSDPE